MCTDNNVERVPLRRPVSCVGRTGHWCLSEVNKKEVEMQNKKQIEIDK